MSEEDREDQLRAHQDGRVYPVGRALRATFDADNHDSLGSDVTGLMIDLSRVPYDETDFVGPRAARPDTVPAAPPLPAPPPSAPTPGRSWRDRLAMLWGAGRPAT